MCSSTILFFPFNFDISSRRHRNLFHNENILTRKIHNSKQKEKQIITNSDSTQFEGQFFVAFGHIYKNTHMIVLKWLHARPFQFAIYCDWEIEWTSMQNITTVIFVIDPSDFLFQLIKIAS